MLIHPIFYWKAGGIDKNKSLNLDQSCLARLLAQHGHLLSEFSSILFGAVHWVNEVVDFKPNHFKINARHLAFPPIDPFF